MLPHFVGTMLCTGPRPTVCRLLDMLEAPVWAPEDLGVGRLLLCLVNAKHVGVSSSHGFKVPQHQVVCGMDAGT